MILSTIIPVYNVEGFLSNTLNSLIKQKYFEDIEVILVDDGSSDNSFKKCQEYSNRFKNIKVIHTENSGVSHARNVGLEYANGDYIHFLDSDDIISDNMYESLFSTLEGYLFDLLVCSVERKNIIRNQSEAIRFSEKKYIYNSNEIATLICESEYNIIQLLFDYVWNKFYKRSIIEKNHLRFDETISLGEDFAFNCLYYKYVNSMYVTNDLLYQYIIRENSLVSKFYSNIIEIRELLYKYQNELFDYLQWYDKGCLYDYHGRIAFGVLRIINNEKCNFSNKEKIHFINRFKMSDLYNCMLVSFKNNESIKTSLFFTLLKNRNNVGIMLVLVFDYFYRKIKKY